MTLDHRAAHRCSCLGEQAHGLVEEDLARCRRVRHGQQLVVADAVEHVVDKLRYQVEARGARSSTCGHPGAQVSQGSVVGRLGAAPGDIQDPKRGVDLDVFETTRLDFEMARR